MVQQRLIKHMNIKCPSCGTILHCDESVIGQEVSCPKCENIFTAVAPIKLTLAEDPPEFEKKHTMSGLYPLKDMPNEVKKNDITGNAIIRSGHPSWWLDGDFIILIIIAFIVQQYFIANKIVVYLFVVLCAYWFIKSIWHHYSFRYMLTATELKLYTGVIIIDEVDVLLRDITMISLKRGLTDWFFESATLVVGTSATASAEIKMPHIPYAKDLKQKINELRNQQR